MQSRKKQWCWVGGSICFYTRKKKKKKKNVELENTKYKLIELGKELFS